MAQSRLTRRRLHRWIGAGVAAITAPAIVRSGFAQSVPQITVRMGYTWASSQYYSIYLLGRDKGFYKEAGEWCARKKVKMVGTDTQALWSRNTRGIW